MVLELPDENAPETAITNIVRDIQDNYRGEYDVEAVFRLMVQAFLMGIQFERDSNG